MLNTSSVAAGFGRHGVCPTFDHLTLKLLCKSHLRWGTFLPNLGTLGLWVLELFAKYAMEGQVDGQKQRLLPPSLWSGHNKTGFRHTAEMMMIIIIVRIFTVRLLHIAATGAVQKSRKC